MKKSVCYIVGSGKFPKKRFKPEKGSLILAADGGYDSLKKAGYVPDIIVGDMDSIKKIPKNIPRLVFPKRKNDTDISLQTVDKSVLAIKLEPFCFCIKIYF